METPSASDSHRPGRPPTVGRGHPPPLGGLGSPEDKGPHSPQKQRLRVGLKIQVLYFWSPFLPTHSNSDIKGRETKINQVVRFYQGALSHPATSKSGHTIDVYPTPVGSSPEPPLTSAEGEGPWRALCCMLAGYCHPSPSVAPIYFSKTNNAVEQCPTLWSL